MEKDQEILGLILETEKNLTKNYAVALTEASNDKLTNELKEQFDEALQNQRDVYNYMSAQGWYKLEYATESKIKQDKEKNQKVLEGLTEI